MSRIPPSLRAALNATGLLPFYHSVVRPAVEAVHKSLREGGPIEQRRTARGCLEMVAASARIRPWDDVAAPPDGIVREVHYLTGRKYWYQTVFCHSSLLLHAGMRIVPVIYDDGTFDDGLEAEARRLFPFATIHRIADLERHLDVVLPASRYPSVRAWRLRQPLTRKLSDLHAGRSGWKLLLDSDMLFFRRPEFIIRYTAAPDRPCYMVDCKTAYGYSHELRSALVDHRPIPDRVNIGIFGLKSQEVDFDTIERWITVLHEREGPRYNITQGLSSMLLAGRECAVAPERDYIVLPKGEEGRRPTAILHHYVSESKRWYFQYGWRIVERQLREAGRMD